MQIIAFVLKDKNSVQSYSLVILFDVFSKVKQF